MLVEYLEYLNQLACKKLLVIPFGLRLKISVKIVVFAGGQASLDICLSLFH